VADDVVALDVREGQGPSVLPGFPRLKVCPRAAAFLGYDCQDLASLQPYDERLVYQDALAFSHTPLPRAAIYVLAEGVDEGVEPLRPREAFLELVRHTRLMVAQVIEATGSASGHFRQCGRLAGCVPVRRLARRMSLPALPDLKRVLGEDLSRLSIQADVTGGEWPWRCFS
jgi:hypothetical protein